MKRSSKRPAGSARLAGQTISLYFAQAKLMPWRLSLSYVFAVLFPLANDVAIPFTIGLITDELVSPDRMPSKVYDLLWLMVGAAVLSTIFARINFMFRNRVLTTTERRLNMLVFDAYERQESGFFANNFVGSLVARSQRFVKTFNDLYDITLFSLTSFIVQLVGPIIILSVIAPVLAFLFVAVALLTFCAIWLTNRFKVPLMRHNAAMGSRVIAELADSVANNLAVKVFSAGSRERRRFYQTAELRRGSFFDQTKMSERIRIVRTTISMGFFIAATYALALLAMDGKITVGTILLVQLYVLKLENSLWELNRISERLEESLADASEMTEVILRQPLVQDVDKPLPLNAPDGRIVFDRVSFNYHDAADNEALFSNLSLDIKPGQKVGLVGPSGGGKTSFTKLLLRFTDIQAGEITIDGQNIAKVRQDDLRACIAYVPQEPLLFHRSIEENIAYGDPEATHIDVVRAAKLAHADEFATKLPQGYETLVGERGVKLSGGEKQRVAIARAMLKKSPIVVLDEATSALDSKSEKAIVSALDNLMRGRTTIVIAHRLSTIRKLDRIVVLKDGKIVEDGSHQQLLKQKGLYAELWQHQSGEFLPDE